MTQCAVTCQNVSKQCSLPVNNNKATPTIHYKGEILFRIPMTDMTIKLGPSTETCLQLSYMFVNYNWYPQLIKVSFPCFSQYLKLSSR